MYILKKDEMQTIDRMASENWEIPSIILMENAGQAIVNKLEELYPNINQMKITIVAGNGNNGGDGLVVARKLHQKGVNVVVFVINEGNTTTEDHAVNRRMLNHLPIRVFDVKNEQQIKILKANLNHADLVLDAIFGVGLNRPLNEFYEAVINLINDHSICTVALDCPSGLDCDTGSLYGSAINACHSLTLAWPKIGLFMPDSYKNTGDIHVLDIGIPVEVAKNIRPKAKLLTDTYLKEQLSPRPANGYKNKYGHVGIIAGSVGMSGALVLSAQAAGRSGAGLITALVDKNIYQVAACMIPEVMVRPVSWPNEKILDWLIEQSSVLLIGPGMGLTEQKEEIVKYVLLNTEKPVILDADGLTLLKKIGLNILNDSKANIVLTPHPGEMARLVDKPVSYCEDNRFALAVKFAETYGVTLVLKGHHSIVVSRNGEMAINAIDSPALSTAGSGDVLSGIIAAFAAQEKDLFNAANTAVALHGRAGARLEEKFGTVAPIASDIINVLPDELKELT